MALRSMLSATTCFRHAYARWQKGGVGAPALGDRQRSPATRRMGASGVGRPRGRGLDAIGEQAIQKVAMTTNLTPRSCHGYRSPVEAFLSELCRDVEVRFA